MFGREEENARQDCETKIKEEKFFVFFLATAAKPRAVEFARNGRGAKEEDVSR
jgi:hypothetical protein